MTPSDAGPSQTQKGPGSAVPPDDAIARGLRGFGPLGILTFLFILLVGNAGVLPFGALLVLAWARGSRTPWRDLGFVWPRHWGRTVVVGILFGAAFKLILKAGVMPLFGAPPINPAYHYLAGNTAALPGAIYAMIVGAGFGEETVFRGYVFERSARLFGRGRMARTLTVLGTSLVFGLGHYANQGVPGVQQATIVGLVFGSIFALTGELWLLMIAHAAFDLTALALIYWNLEAQVAHFIFK